MGELEYGVWPNPQYPPVKCSNCGDVVPEQDAAWGFLGYRQLWVPFVLPEGAARVEMGVHLSYSALYGMTFISGTDLRFASLLNSNYLDAYLSSLV